MISAKPKTISGFVPFFCAVMSFRFVDVVRLSVRRDPGLHGVEHRILSALQLCRLLSACTCCSALRFSVCVLGVSMREPWCDPVEPVS